MKKSQTIPVVDLRDYGADSLATRQKFIATVGRALENFGFFALEGHGVDSAFLDKAYGLAYQLFELGDPAKRHYEIAGLGGQRGYTSFGREHAKNNPAPDLKEFWHVGRELPAWHGLARLYLKNIWPAEIEEFKDTFLKLYAAMDECSLTILKAVSEYLGEDKDFLPGIARDGNTILRLIHYPPVPEDRHPDSIRSSAHEDINLITFLCEATDDGL